VILTMPLLEGLDGVNKMSKSLGNYVGIHDPAEEMFGKLMSISDELMWRYIELLSFESLETVAGWKRSVAEGANPRDIKGAVRPGDHRPVPRPGGGEAALEDFEARFRHGEVPRTSRSR